MVDRLLLKMPVRLGPMAFTRRGACPHAQDQIAAEDSRLYTRTDRSDEAGSGNLSELALDVSEKEGEFRLFSSSLFQVSSKRF
jgi:hypothetical protein